MAHPKLNETDGPVRPLIDVEVPAKAMLFGEYGVLQGGSAVVFLIDSIRKKVRFELTDSCGVDEAVCIFESAFFENPVTIKKDDLRRLPTEQSESEGRNLSCYLNGFFEFLDHRMLSAQVMECFSPSLGFGSSSALLVAFQMALSRFTSDADHESELLTSEYWERIYRALLLLQRKGSGYDVATQSWAVARNECGRSRVVQFSNPAWMVQEFHPQVQEISLSDAELGQLGCFVKTGVRSDTRSVLQTVARKNWPAEFYLRQARWAQEFIAHPSVQSARDLCRESATWARRFELIPANADALAFIDMCDAGRIPWKTMGAGHGDCLWVMASKEQINELLAQRAASNLSVSFAFEEGV